jgi:hypothetical protein
VHSTSTSAHSASDTLRRGESKVFAAIHNRQPAHAEHTHTHSHACPERDSAVKSSQVKSIKVKVTFLFHLQMIVGRLSVFYSSMSCRRTLLVVASLNHHLTVTQRAISAHEVLLGANSWFVLRCLLIIVACTGSPLSVHPQLNSALQCVTHNSNSAHLHSL